MSQVGDDADDFAAEYASWQQAVKDWKAKWPNHCQHCGGWGGSSYTENHGIPGPGETIFDPCGALEENKCHRCGQEGLEVDEHGDYTDQPCKFCGWQHGRGHDDGVPEF